MASFPAGCSDYFAIFGAVAASYLALKFACALLGGLRSYILGGGANLKRFGEWAVVTGATDGIGKAYAQELAKAGINIVLVSRSPEKLSDVAAEIENKYKVKTKTIPVDFTGGLEIYDKVRAELEGMEIGTLVNNVGMGYAHPMYFAEIPNDKVVADLININIYSVSMMTRIVLPGMLERKKGAIINLSSASGAAPMPLLTVYSAAKAYVDFFSRALQQEYGSRGIIVQSQLPYFVSTKLSKIRRANMMVPAPTTYVKSALKTLGTSDWTFGYWAHAVQGFLLTNVLPGWLVQMLTTSNLKATRAKALKKAQKTQ